MFLIKIIPTIRQELKQNIDLKFKKGTINFVTKKKMPRTALRYAIEKMPKSLKEKAMK